MSHLFDNLPEKLNLVYGILAGSLFSQFRSEDSIISLEAQDILQNPVDRKIIDDAVQELKKDPVKGKKNLILSNNKEITITVE